MATTPFTSFPTTANLKAAGAVQKTVPMLVEWGSGEEASQRWESVPVWQLPDGTNFTLTAVANNDATARAQSQGLANQNLLDSLVASGNYQDVKTYLGRDEMQNDQYQTIRMPKGSSSFAVPDAVSKNPNFGATDYQGGSTSDLYKSINSGAYIIKGNTLYTGGGHAYDLKETGTDNVYGVRLYPKDGGSYVVPIAANLDTGKAAMPDKFVDAVQRIPESKGGLSGFFSSMGDLARGLGPIGNIGLAALTGGLSIPEQIAAQTAFNMAKGQPFDQALLSGAVAGGASSLFGGGAGSAVDDGTTAGILDAGAVPPSGATSLPVTPPTDLTSTTLPPAGTSLPISAQDPFAYTPPADASSATSDVPSTPSAPSTPSVPDTQVSDLYKLKTPKLSTMDIPTSTSPTTSFDLNAPSTTTPFDANAPSTTAPSTPAVPDQAAPTSTTLPISAQDPFAEPTADQLSTAKPISQQDPFAEPTPQQLNPPSTSPLGSDLYKLAAKTPYEPGISATPSTSGYELASSTPAEGLQAGPNANLQSMGGGQGLTAAGAGGIGSISEAGLNSGLLTEAGLAGGLGTGLAKTSADVASSLAKNGIDASTGNIIGSPGGLPTGSGGGSGLTGMGALAGGLGLAGLLALMNSDSSRFGTPGRATYSGPLSQYKFNPAMFKASTPDPMAFRPTGVTTVADQAAAAQPMRAMSLNPFASMQDSVPQNPFADVNQDPVQTMSQLGAAGLGAQATGMAKGGSVKPQYTSKGKLAAMDPWSRAAAEYQNNAYMAQMPVAPTAAPTGPALGQLNLSGGGQLGSYSDGGHMLKGPGDGMSDSIPATIGGKRPARLADGEFVVPADVVSHLGNGSTEAGARELYKMMDKVRQARTGRKAQGKQINPGKFMPK